MERGQSGVMGEMIRVALADAETILRHALQRLLAEQEGMRVCREAANGEEALAVVENQDVDVLVMEPAMPSPNGPELIRMLRRRAPRVSILVLSSQDESRHAVRAIRAGARGYLVKTCRAEQLLSAIRQVHAGQVYVNAELTQRLALGMLTEAALEPHQALSEREQQVFLQLVEGRSVGQIARALNLSSKTVSTHKTRILRKMQMDSVAALVRYAVNRELLDASGPGSTTGRRSLPT